MKKEINIWADTEYLFMNKRNGDFTIMKLTHVKHGNFANFIETKRSSWSRVSINQFNKKKLTYIGKIQYLDEEQK